MQERSRIIARFIRGRYSYTPTAGRKPVRHITMLAVGVLLLALLPVASKGPSSTGIAAVDAATNRSMVHSFSPVADARVLARYPNANYGKNTLLITDGSQLRESYLRFRVTGISGTVQSARLRLYVHDGSADGPAIYATRNPWWETGIKWKTRPGPTSAAIDDKGVLQANTWVEYDVTSRVNGNGLYSFVLATASSDSTSVHSREHATGRPELVVSMAGADPVLAGAGDIADCGGSGDEATASLLDNISGTVFSAGDNAYADGTSSEFTDCYGPTWGRHKDRTHPSPGNHDYHTSGASGYYGYFGAAAGDPGKGYYSYDLGSWHVIALNSNCGNVGGCGAGSQQEQWLRADLAAHPTTCTVAYWHHPRFSSGPHGSDGSLQPLWQALYDNGADVVVSGHDHDYERFAPQDPSGKADSARGIREFVVGTGGKSHYGIGSPIANSEVNNGGTFGVIKLTLHAAGYDWEFVPVAGQSFTDSGSTSCHQ